MLSDERSAKVQKRWRVKLYELDEGKWVDNGTGVIDASVYPTPKIVMTEEDNQTEMFEFLIDETKDFHLQRKTILTWKSNSEEKDDDIGISFQEKDGINEIRKFIRKHTGKEISDDTENSCEYLSDVSRDNLPFIAREIRLDLEDNQKEELINNIKGNDYAFIQRLGEVLVKEEKALDEIKSSISKSTGLSSESFGTFNMDIDKISNCTTRKSKAIRLPQMENLSFIFTIFKNLFLLSDKELIEHLLSNDLHLITFGALDYDFESQQAKKAIRHRDYFTSNAKFRNVLSIMDEAILKVIHLNYRLAYLKDVAIPNDMTESLKSIITVMIASNNRTIVQFFLSNGYYLNRLMKLLKVNQSMCKWDIWIIKNSCKFIIELLHCAKDSIDHNKLNEALCDYGLLIQVETLLSHPIKVEIGDLLTEIVFDIHNDNSLFIQEHILSSSTNQFMSVLLEYVFTQSQSCPQMQYEQSQMIQSLFSIGNSKELIEKLLSSCFTSLLGLLHSPLIPSLSKEIALETITNCLSSAMHYYQLHQWTKDNLFISRVIAIKSTIKGKRMQLQLIKFIKALFEHNYDIDIISSNFDWLFELFNGKKDNIISSAVISLFAFVAEKRVHLVNGFFKLNSGFFYGQKELFAALIRKYDELNGKEGKISSDLLGKTYENEDESEKENEMNSITQLDNYEFDSCEQSIYDLKRDREEVEVFLGRKVGSMMSFDELFTDFNYNIDDDIFE